jgi:hypothetical protein
MEPVQAGFNKPFPQPLPMPGALMLFFFSIFHLKSITSLDFEPSALSFELSTFSFQPALHVPPAAP